MVNRPEQGYDLREVLQQINPAMLEYQDWVNVGMGLKHEGYTASDWEEWSRRDAGRYHPGECFRKWDSFRGTATPVTGGTLVQMAKDQGWAPAYSGGDYELEWDASIGGKIIDKAWVEDVEVVEPGDWNPAEQLVRYLQTLFEASENVGYVTESWHNEKEDRYLPTKGAYDRTAGELIQKLNQCGGDIGSVLGDFKPEAGAWIRFNPLDGKGVKNDNVTDYRFSLVECDNMAIDKQNAIIRELELPVACLVHSGKKSLHAIVRIEASSYEEYRKRVDYLYAICKKNGLEVDTQNKNPSRLSRMPGALRNGRKQFLIDTNIGKASWQEWFEWIEGVNDDLPEPERLTDVWSDLPDLAPPLIDGVLRQGHKMLLAGPSKAGKSYSLIELCCAIAEGRRWLSWSCAKGRVLYVNLELDRASCLHRFRDVYEALGWEPEHLDNIDIWNLRGKAVPMDKLAPKLIRRAAKRNYIAIVIDPIYKVITGDENSADQMAYFCNQFDRVCTELGCAVIYCHHHSKGTQGQKRSMDRASGSGVFARDPDAMLDLIELDLTDALLKQEENKAVCKACVAWLDANVSIWEDHVSQDDALSQSAILEACRGFLTDEQYLAMTTPLEAVKRHARQRTAWRVEGTLREFPKFNPVNMWFDYPVHHVDGAELLTDLDADGDMPPWKKATEARKKTAEKSKKESREAFENAIQLCAVEGQTTTRSLIEYFAGDKSENTIYRWIKQYGYAIDKNTGVVTKEITQSQADA